MAACNAVHTVVLHGPRAAPTSAALFGVAQAIEAGGGVRHVHLGPAGTGEDEEHRDARRLIAQALERNVRARWSRRTAWARRRVLVLARVALTEHHGTLVFSELAALCASLPPHLHRLVTMYV